MRIIQLVTSLSYGDAIGNDVIAIHQTLETAGFDSFVMAVRVHPAAKEKVKLLPVSASQVHENDVVIFHKAAGDSLTGLFERFACLKILLYHNITPASFFMPYDWLMSWNLARGRRQLKRIAKVTDCAWGDSEYNAQELRAFGCDPQKLHTLPIILNNFGHRTEPDAAMMKRLTQQEGTRFLFVGRIAPNKKQEDVIKVFAAYQRFVDPKAQLHLVGSWQGNEKYYAKIMGFIADLKLEGVHFSGHITDEELAAYYRSADVFVCMSEHEGFCVPLLEAMQSDVPVVAYAAAAVPETLGDNGLLFQKKDYEAIARRIEQLLTSETLRLEVLDKQRKNLDRFQPAAVKQRLLDLLQLAIKEKNHHAQ